MGFALQIEAALSFLGPRRAAADPVASGVMLADGRDVLDQAPWVEIFPGLAIAITVLGFDAHRRRAARVASTRGGGR